MAFFDWLGSHIGDVADALGAASSVLGKGSDKQTSDISSGIIGRAIAQATKAGAATPNNRFPVTQVASKRPAQVVGDTNPIFKGTSGDPWLTSMRQILQFTRSSSNADQQV